MNIDERIEKLTERHEALAQTVELMAHSIQELSDRTNENINKIISAINQDGENIRALARIAEARQTRIENLEQRPQ